MSRSSRVSPNPLTPERQWKAVAISTLVLVPAFWALLVGMVAVGDDSSNGPHAGAAFALGFALLPFVFVAAAFLTQHPQAPGAALRAMGMSLLVGIPVSAVAGDAVTGLVAGVGAGAVMAVRHDGPEGRRPRAAAVALASVYTFVLVRTAGPIALLSAPVFPFTAVALADTFMARRREQASAAR